MLFLRKNEMVISPPLVTLRNTFNQEIFFSFPFLMKNLPLRNGFSLNTSPKAQNNFEKWIRLNSQYGVLHDTLRIWITEKYRHILG